MLRQTNQEREEYDIIFKHMAKLKSNKNVFTKEKFFINFGNFTDKPFAYIMKMDNLSDSLKSELCYYVYLLLEVNDIYYSEYNYTLEINLKDLHIRKSNYQGIIENEILLIINEIQSKLKDKRSKILGKVYNYSTNKVEYELEDGNFIVIDENDNPIKTPLPLDLTCFPIEYLNYIENTPMIRDINIDNILK